MRMASALSLLPLVAGAAGAQTLPAQHVPGSGGLGITVKVLPPDTFVRQPLRYVLSEPGYVAAFIIYPGAGVRLLYPTVDIPEKLEYAGYHSDQLIGASFDNDVYRAVLGPGSPIGPAYLYVIASRHPLDVARYVHRPMRLASAVGEKESRSFYSDVQFDALLNNAISLGDDYSWDSDVYMLWPNSAPGRSYADGRTWDGVPRPAYVYVTCTDGSKRLVPLNYPFEGCPGQWQIRANPVTRARQSASFANTSAGSGDAATVLPTIIGKPATAAEARVAMRDGAVHRVATTEVANGAEEVVSPASAQQSSAVELQTIAVTPRSPEAARIARDDIHGAYSAERRARYADEQRMRTQNAQIANSPQLAPSPMLPPSPGLAPNPGFPSRGGAQVQVNNEDAARYDRQDRQMRSSRGDGEQGQARRQFNEQRQEQARQRQEPRAETRVEPRVEGRQQESQPAPRAEPARSAPPPVTPVPMASARMASPVTASAIAQ